MIQSKDYAQNLQSYLYCLEPDEAGLSPSDISRVYGISPEDLVMLNRNENPYGPSPLVWEAVMKADPSRYPEPEQFARAASGYTGYGVENIVVGAGMDEIIGTVSRLFLGPGDRALIPVPTYTYYATAVGLCGARPIYLDRGRDFAVPKLPEGLKLAFLCSPNNPTGDLICEETLRSMLESFKGIVFLDEAYAEFAGTSHAGLVEEYENLVVGRTMSKAFGLAGMRLGYALVPEWVAEQYRRAAPLFGISSTSIAAGVAAFGDLEHMHRSVSAICKERERLLSSLPLARESKGNFLFVGTEERSMAVVERLMKKGIAVKDCSTVRGAGERHIRLTVGTPDQNDRFLDAF